VSTAEEERRAREEAHAKELARMQEELHLQRAEVEKLRGECEEKAKAKEKAKEDEAELAERVSAAEEERMVREEAHAKELAGMQEELDLQRAEVEKLRGECEEKAKAKEKEDEAELAERGNNELKEAQAEFIIAMSNTKRRLALHRCMSLGYGQRHKIDHMIMRWKHRTIESCEAGGVKQVVPKYQDETHSCEGRQVSEDIPNCVLRRTGVIGGSKKARRHM